ncbi:MAG: hypothetical protein FXF47_09420 [Candidatus Mcinerneyibacterium aminivorans]|jgi:Fe2+ or Zn2+ uptake regulation protein|uniref:Uncharacterized protein n=1 Tax=Candidatus Mcinerneyibacterium aminivorans TaxID=2703815 RepID=A0A5D0MGI2_9BACT|nr:MAG: hypothetical protein FXF47_09420 [Candidatus Mcinerneyibacterium aminivorans]
MFERKNTIGKRPPKARDLLMNLFKKISSNLPIKDIYNRIKDENIDNITIYRNLDLIEKRIL